MQAKLQGKKIIVGITGSIAAYKSAFLVRQLIRNGCEVNVIMTRAATAFISPLTLSTLSGSAVLTDISSEDQWNSHVELGLWADVLVLAPLTANTMARMAMGIADNLLLATYLSARCPVAIAPAMDLDMWQHPSTKRNLERLRKDGVHTIPVGYGELASGLVGEGRMAEPEEIVSFLPSLFERSGSLSGKRIMITAGPTHEAIDPVRFIGNRSTGKMGVSIADEASKRGAEVDLILGPSHIRPTSSDIRVHEVTTAREMFERSQSLFSDVDGAILSAAVADYRPAYPSDQKIKKGGGRMQIELERTKDIAASLAEQKRDQIIVGFALETKNEESNAMVKLNKKKFDMIVLNSLNDAGAGFGYDTNKVTFLFPGGLKESFPLKSKTEVASDILDSVESLLEKKNI